ncbi:MAG: S1 RNA-binding domain-containing protein [Anaerolineae bacterium]|nr:S1 RNA-binding domain-containing protein [Anaerolineae bacterium]
MAPGMEEKTDQIKPKMKFTGKVVKLSLAGALIDIGSRQPAVLHISQITAKDKADAIKRVEDVLEVGQELDVWVRRVRDDHIELTMNEPLPLEWRDIKEGMVVKGKVVRLEKFGAFVEIGAERPGLIHISELAQGYVRTPDEVVKEGDEVEAKVLEVIKRKKQIKLSIKALMPELENITLVEKTESHAGSKPARRKKGGQKQHEREADLTQDETSQEPEPTSMQMAWEAAMERVKTQKDDGETRKSKGVSQEQEDILARTLEKKQP